MVIGFGLIALLVLVSLGVAFKDLRDRSAADDLQVDDMKNED